jgi:DNA-binding SARP family transcriptional activator
MNDGILKAIDANPVYLTVCADDVALRLGEIGPDLAMSIRQQASAWPGRWRPVLRRAMDVGSARAGTAAALVLDEIGVGEDVPRLRAFAKAGPREHRSSLGRGLARRLAPRAHLNDLGHVSLDVGGRLIDGSEVRRKVLSLICFLLTKPGFTATRDQVLEALWPDLEPAVAVNSLNQTVYFLRRVFEDPYREDESANYLHHDGEVVRLDAALTTSQSAKCRGLVDRARATLDRELTEQLSQAYRGRFAIDFEYEDWASPYRETLHAAYLDVIEQTMRAESTAGRYDHAASLARRALDVDPEASSIERALLLLYRFTGSHSAAAEQLSHYTSEDEDQVAAGPS